MSASEPLDIQERVRVLREEVMPPDAVVETLMGPIEERLAWVVCNGCARVVPLGFDRLGLDWPEQLEGWRAIGGEDLCPSCVEARGGP